jgi:hypothetical protein
LEPASKETTSKEAINKELTPLLVKRSKGQLCKNSHITIFLQNVAKYEDSRQAKITSLLEKGIFEVILKSKVLRGSRIFNFKFVNKMKNKGTKNKRKKSRLVV